LSCSFFISAWYSRGIILTQATSRLVFAIIRWRWGSNAAPPQFTPPTFPGTGWHAAGEVASEMAVRITSDAIGLLRGISDEEASDRMRTAKDDSFVQEQVEAGLLTPGQARGHPYSSIITRCVGASGEVVPDIYFGSLEQGDIILLASDGLTGMLEDEQLLRILSSDGERTSGWTR
jgi:hypothetical protein